MDKSKEQTVTNIIEAAAGLTAESSAILIVDKGDTYHEIGLNLSAIDRLQMAATILQSTLETADAKSVEAGAELRGMIMAMVVNIL